jgi:hypothetical protein
MEKELSLTSACLPPPSLPRPQQVPAEQGEGDHRGGAEGEADGRGVPRGQHQPVVPRDFRRNQAKAQGVGVGAVGLYKLNPVYPQLETRLVSTLTHSLKAPGFNPDPHSLEAPPGLNP